MRVLARAIGTIAIVIAGVAILALTAGPVAAPADSVSMTDATVTPGAAGALVSPNRLANTLEPTSIVASAAPGEAGVLITPSTAPAGVSTTAATLPPGVPTTAAALPTTQATAPGSLVTPVAQSPAQPTASTASPTETSPTATSPSVAPPSVAPPTDTAPIATSPDPTETAPSPPATYDDIGDFESFLLQHRSSIAGQPFDIVSLTVDTSDAAVPYFVLGIGGGESTDVFVAQTAADSLEYGRILLGDVVRYIGGGSCTVVVNSIYQTASADACAAATPWCQVGPKDESSGTWTVDWVYVRAMYENGVASIEAWNSTP